MVEPAHTSAGWGCYVLARDTLLVQGPDRKSWLDGLVSCAVSSVEQRVGGYGLLLNKQGKILTDVLLLDDGRQLFVGVAPRRGAATRELLDRYLVMEDAELSGPEQALGWRLVTGGDLSLVSERAAARVSALGALELAGLKAVVVALPTADEGELSARLGTPVQGEEALSLLLARHGLGVFGVDFGERDNPHEASLDRVAISWTKGCYLGQEVVCMQDMRGKVKRRLVLLEVQAATPASELPGADVIEQRSGSVAGKVTSVHPEPDGSQLLLASVATPSLDVGAELSVLGHRVRVVPTAMPRVE